MDQYIKKLLSAEPRVIIPQFGSIQALREDTVSLSFNQYLNFDDGKLAAEIQKDSGVSEEEAQRMIRDAVDSYNNQLQDGQTVTMAGIGTFHSDGEGHVIFEQDPNYTDDAPAEQPTTPPTTPQPVAEEPAEAPFPKPEPEADIPQGDKKSHKGLWVTVAIVLLLIIIWLLLFVLFKDNAVYKFFCGPKAPATEQVQPAPAPAKADTTAKSEPETKADAAVKEAKPAAKAQPTAAQPLKKRYNIIVGSYKDEQAALRRVEDLKSKGFSEAFVGMRKDHFVAVLADFGSISEAERVQEQIVDGPYHIESWITNSGEYGR